jgi:hypothetical protein
MSTAGQEPREMKDGSHGCRRYWRLTLTFALASLCLFGIAVVGGPFEESNSYDLTVGRQCCDYRLFGVTVRQKVYDTGLSRLYRRLVGPLPAPEWRAAYGTKSWGLTGVIWDGAYGSEAYTAHWLGDVLEEGPFTDEARREAVLDYLDLTRRSQTAAWRYAELLSGLAGQGQSPKSQPIRPPDLPDPGNVLEEWPPGR